MEDVWQPDDVIQALIEELKADETIWALLLSRWQESNEFVKLGEKLGKRPDLEPEYFPRPSRPTISEIMASFLERKFGRKYIWLNTQLALKASRFAKTD